MRRLSAVILIALLATVAAAQDGPTRIETVPPSDASASVPLRDFLSNRIDQLREELRQSEETAAKIRDERDRQYTQRMDGQDATLATALANSKEAIAKAETANEKRLDGVNEFRAQLTDQASTFLTKDAAEARFKAIEDKIEVQRAEVERLSTRLAAVETAGTPLAQQSQKDIAELNRKVGDIEAQGRGLSQVWAGAATLVGMIVGGFVVWNIVKRRTAPLAA